MAQFTIPGAGPVTVDEADNELQFKALRTGLLSYGALPLIYGDSSGMQFKVRANQFAMVEGSVWGSGDTDFPVAVSSNAGPGTRLDRAVLQLDRSTWDITVEVVEGVAGAGLPAIDQDDWPSGVYQYDIGQISVAQGAITIAAATVVPRLIYLGTPLLIGNDGAATNGNMPPVALRWAPDLQQLLLHTQGATASGVKSLLDDTGWTVVTPASGWTGTGGTVRLRRKNGVVYCVYNIIRTSAVPAGEFTNMFTLPSPNWPGLTWFDGADAIGAVGGRVEVSGTGVTRYRDDEALSTSDRISGSFSFPIA